MPHILWIDNYSKILGDRYFSGDGRPYSIPLWTAYAVRPLSVNSANTLETLTDALPPKPFMLFPNIIDYMKDIDLLQVEDYQPHTCVKIGMYSVPPGPGLRDTLEGIKFWKDRKDVSMRTLIPWKIESQNCASNDVLLKILKEEISVADNKPTWLLMDINLFSRSLRVSPL